MASKPRPSKAALRAAALLLALVGGALTVSPISVQAQTRGRQDSQSSHITIPSLANATRPVDLEFEAGECEVDASGTTMECRFRQVFLTPAAFDPQTCLITTNGYERTFQKQAANRWVSRSEPEGVCGLTDTATLQNDGGAMWTMDMRKTATKKDADPSCRRMADVVDTLSWRNVRRPLACRFIQPGAMSR